MGRGKCEPHQICCDRVETEAIRNISRMIGWLGTLRKPSDPESLTRKIGNTGDIWGSTSDSDHSTDQYSRHSEFQWWRVEPLKVTVFCPSAHRERYNKESHSRANVNLSLCTVRLWDVSGVVSVLRHADPARKHLPQGQMRWVRKQTLNTKRTWKLSCTMYKYSVHSIYAHKYRRPSWSVDWYLS